MKLRSFLLSAGLCCSLFVLNGCQTVSGIDSDQLLAEHSEVDSYEGSFNFSITRQFPATISGDNQGNEKYYDSITSFALNLQRLHYSKESGVWSAEGAFENLHHLIPFQLSGDSNKVVILPEGAKRALQLSGQPIYENEQWALLSVLQRVVGSHGADLKKAAQIIASALPQADNLKAEQVRTPINGTEMNGTRISLSFEGDQLAQYIQQYVQNFSQDEQSLRQLADIVNGSYVSDPIWSEWAGSEKNRFSPTTETFYTAIKNELSIARDSYRIENMSSHRKTDIMLFFDTDKRLRQLKYEMLLESDSGYSKGMRSVYSLSLERWNPVENAKPKQLPDADALDLSELMTYRSLQDTAEYGSELFQYLEREFDLEPREMLIRLTDKDFVIGLAEYNEKPQYYRSVWGYSSDGIGYGDINNLAYWMDYEMEWDESSQTAKITDRHTTMQLQAGSSTMVLNGKEVEMPGPVVKHGSYLFVPIRVVAEALGCQVEALEDYSNRIGVHIRREK